MSEAAEQLPDNIDMGEPAVETPPETPQEEVVAAEPEHPPKVEFDETQQRIFNEEIGKKVAKQREAERKAEELERKAADLEAKLKEVSQPQRPHIPDAPDPFADDYEAQVKARDDALLRAAEYDTQQRFAHEQAQQAQHQSEMAQRQQLVESVQSYSERAGKLGIAADELQQAGNMVGQYGLHDDVVDHILRDRQGPSLTLYLANNPLELEQVRQMKPTLAAIYLENQIKAKAVASRPRPDLAPAPVETVRGSGAPEPEGGVPGVVYE